MAEYFDYTTVYTEDETMRRVWDAEVIKDLMSRRAVYNAADRRRDELNDLWVREEKHRATAAYGGDWGYYVGMAEISRYYVALHDKRRKENLALLRKHHPEVPDGAIGTGCIDNHPVSSPFIEIAEDGSTARGLWYSFGQESWIGEDGEAEGCWMLSKYAADFALEGGEWKIWHIVVSNDVYTYAGVSFGEQKDIFGPGENLLEQHFGKPTIPMLTHDAKFCWLDDYPPMPRPYVTFSAENSYGPEGHPDFKGGLRK